MKKVLSVVALLLVIGAAVFFVSDTKEEYDWVVKIDGSPITPQEYVTAQIQSYIKAQIVSGQENVLDAEIQDMSGEEWITQHSIKLLKKYKYITNLAKEKDITINEGMETYIDYVSDESWNDVKTLYTKNGITQEYYTKYIRFLQLEQLVFNSLYLGNGELGVEDEEVGSYLDENLRRIQFFAIPKHRPSGEKISEEENNVLRGEVEKAVENITDGADMESTAYKLMEAAGFNNVPNPVEYIYLNKASAITGGDSREEVSNMLFDLDRNEALYYETSNLYYICQSVELCDTNVEYMCLRQDVVTAMKNEEFQNKIWEHSAGMNVEYNEAAMEKYSPSRIDLSIN